MKTFPFFLFLLGISCVHAPKTPLAHRILILDTHIDVPYRLSEKMEDVTQRTAAGDFDLVRAREGGLDGTFMSIYVPASYQKKEGGKEFADRMIDWVEEIARKSQGRAVITSSTEEIERNFRQGKFSLLLGIENGAAIEDELGFLEHFHRRGVRYITLTHSKDNLICDSSYDPNRTWKGLSPFGEKVVEEMNRLGIMIDVSHISDDAFHQVMEKTSAPVIASHSSCRHFTPDWERNMSDEMIRKLAARGGVIHINFGSAFLCEDIQKASDAEWAHLKRWSQEQGIEESDPRYKEEHERYLRENPAAFADIVDVLDHIDHVVRLVGVDHVGFGSDFDGVGDSLPAGLKDVADFSHLIERLQRRGYSEEEMVKIAGGNLLRVFRDVERIAREKGAKQVPDLQN